MISEKIAVIGISCLLPGAENYKQYWQNLLRGVNSKITATSHDMGVDPNLYYSEKKGTPDRYYCMEGGFVRDFNFDSGGYNLPGDYLEKLDNMFKWSLYVSKDALRDSGYLNKTKNLERCGIILGNLSFPTRSSNMLCLPIYQKALESSIRKTTNDHPFNLKPFTAIKDVSHDNLMISGYPAALVSKALNLKGNDMVLDAACSSSIYSVKVASDYLLSGKTDMMLAGAVSCADPFFINMGFSIFQAYPNIPESSPLDKASRGLIAGEGAGVFVLKRLSDAIRDKDRVYATISGIGLSNDGRGQSVLSPSSDGQTLAYERAYRNAGIDPGKISFVECHATGTPVGDKVEVDSMDTFFGKHGASPYVGSSKSNVGHLLTAAGMTGMIKTILSMNEKTIPATIGIKEPQNSKNNIISNRQIPVTTIPWPDTDTETSQYAAVSGFGFGGTNGHIIFEHHTNDTVSSGNKPDEISNDSENVISLFEDKKKPLPKADVPLAVIGMDAIFGTSTGIPEFHRTIYEGLQLFMELPEKRWKGIETNSSLLKEYGITDGKPPRGAYLEKFDIDFLGFRIPPNKDDRLIPQQLLALKVADNALKDAGISEGSKTAVLAAMGTELALHQFRGRVNLTTQLDESFPDHTPGLSDHEKEQLKNNIKSGIHGVAQVNQYTSFIGNIMASRISSLWDFSGPSFSISSEENSVFKALEVARFMLAAKEVDAVVVTAVDLSGGFENVLLKNQVNKINSGNSTFSFDTHANGWMIGEGAGAVVLKRRDIALKEKCKIYSTLNSLSFSKGLSSESITENCRKASHEAGIALSDVGYLEAFASGIKGQDDVEIKGIIDAYSESGKSPGCAIGSIKSNIGHTFASSGMAALIKTSLCLYNRFLPATPGWTSPKYPEKWERSPFFVPSDSRTWFKSSTSEVRVAAINGLGADETCAHLILSDEPGQAGRRNEYLTRMPLSMFPLAGNTLDEILSELSELTHSLEKEKNMTKVAGKCFNRFNKVKIQKYRTAIIGQDKREIYDEIECAKSEIPLAFKNRKPWESKNGSYFTPEPLGKKGKITFVYPGGYNSYVGLGKNLFQLFPEAYETAGNYTAKFDTLAEQSLIHPRSMTNFSESDIVKLSKDLFNSPVVMFESGIMSAVLYTDIIRDSFKINPNHALGYSMGEVSMLFALDVWHNMDEIHENIINSQFFKSRVSGSMKNVIDAWNLTKDESENKKFWYSYKLSATPAAVRRELKKDRDFSKGRSAYLIFVNTQQEVVIGGYDQACRRVIKNLGCSYQEVPVSDIIHSELVKPDYEELLNLHRLPVNKVENIDFYSAFNFAPIVMDSDVIAENMANIYTNEIDFQKLIETSYEDGARIFIELGPRNNCKKWINEILLEKDHLAVSVNNKDGDENLTIIQALTKLFCHHIEIDLSPLFINEKREKVSKRLLVKTITPGGNHITENIESPKNVQRIKKMYPEIEVKEEKSSLKKERYNSFIPNHINRNNSETARITNNRSDSVPMENQTHKSIPATGFEDAGSFKENNSFENNVSLLNQAHKRFLESRIKGSGQLTELIGMQIHSIKDGSEKRVNLKEAHLETSLKYPIKDLFHNINTNLPSDIIKKPVDHPGVIWNSEDLLEFAEGKIENVFGKDYSVIDTYKRRVRLPMEDYLLVTRVTELDAARGEFKPSGMTTEYDIPMDSPLTIDGQIPWAVSVESGQCDLLLISYLGIDFQCRGERVYRLLDCTLTFMEDIAMEGETLRYEISINSFAKSGESLLFFFSYRCFVKETLVLKMDGGCAGFFTDGELDAGKGIIYSEEELAEREATQKQTFKPFLICSKKKFNRKDLLNIVHGDRGACFGKTYELPGLNPSLRFASEKMLMIDQVETIDIKGGPWGLGSIEGIKELDPKHWYFPCHFMDDQVMAGSLMAEGCGQLLQFFLLYIGMHTQVKDARFQPIKELPQKVRCRGQVTPQYGKLRYRLEVKEIGLEPFPYAIANIDILLDDRIVVDFKDLGVRMVEKNVDDPYKITLPESDAANTKTDDLETIEKKALYTQYHLQHFAKGTLSECFGPAFKIYDGRTAPRTPNGDLQLTTRIMEVSGTPGDFLKPAYTLAEYDVPEDAWFYTHKSHPTVMPYSVIMEIALQPCGFISACMETTLLYPDTDFYFRNLDGTGTLHRDIDLRGKTIKNKATLLTTAALGNTIIQTFTFHMSVDGDDYYTGTAAFGYFVASALTDQVGLDSGIDNHPLTEKKYLSGSDISSVNLKSEDVRKNYYNINPAKPHYRLSGPQLDFLSDVRIVQNGGEKGKGYIYAERPITRSDWFFDCHFYQDPVMPGSLGVESVMQALEVFVLHNDLGKQFTSPRITQTMTATTWKYRGQINPNIDSMAIEVHITNIEKSEHKVKVTANASLWKDKIRIYEIKDISLILEES